MNAQRIKIIIIALMLVGVIVAYTINSGNYAQKVLDQCKSKGYDGIKIISTIPAQFECWHEPEISQARKDAILGVNK